MKENNKSKFTLIDDRGVEKEYEMLFTFDSDETKNIYPIESEKEWLTICNILNSIQAKIKDEK